MRLLVVACLAALVGACGGRGSDAGPGAPPAMPGAVAPPVNVRAEGIPGGARVSWDPPPAGGPAPFEYDVESSPAGARAAVSPPATSVELTGLVEGATYTFAVRAHANVEHLLGISAPALSNPLTVRTVWPAGAWSQGPALPEQGARLAGAAGGYLYAVGAASVYASKLGADGAPGAWSAAGSHDGAACGESALAIQAREDGTGALFVQCGGQSMSGYRGDVRAAPLRDGAMGPLAPTAGFSPGAAHPALVSDGDRLYAIGGSWWSGGSFTGVGSPLAFVHVADVALDGSLSAWCDAALLPLAGTWRAAVRQRHVYVLAPHGDGIDVFVGDLQADGAIAGWRRASARPGAHLVQFAVAAVGDFLYVLGGSDYEPGSPPFADTVLVGRVDSSGDVVSWEQSAADRFNGPRQPSVVAAGGHLYLSGGAFSDVQWATPDPATGHLAPASPPPSPRPPSAPLRVRASPLDGAALVRWERPIDDGGTSITGYVVKRWPTGETVEAGPEATQAIFGGLRPGPDPWASTFEVFARNAAGTGPGSGPTEDVLPSRSPRWRAVPFGPPAGRPVFAAGPDLFAPGPNFTTLPVDGDGVPWTAIGPGWEGGSGYWAAWALAARSLDASTTCAYAVGGTDRGTNLARTQVTCLRSDRFEGTVVSTPPARDAAAWEREPDSALSVGRFELAAANDRLYVTDGFTLVARLDPATGHLLPW